jgi:hypothetical protein
MSLAASKRANSKSSILRLLDCWGSTASRACSPQFNSL